MHIFGKIATAFIYLIFKSLIRIIIKNYRSSNNQQKMKNTAISLRTLDKSFNQHPC